MSGESKSESYNSKVLEGGDTLGIYSVMFSPDSKFLVSGSIVGTMHIWDANSWELLNTLEDAEAGSLSFSSDGKLIASAVDLYVRVRNAVSGELLLTLGANWAMVTSVSFSPDENIVVSGWNDSMVRVYDAVSGELLLTLEGHTDYVNSVSFSGDGKLIVSGSSDKTVRVWNAVSGVCVLGPLQGHTGVVSSVSFFDDDTKIVSGSGDKTLRVWDVDEGDCLHILRGHTREVTSVSCYKDLIVSGSEDKTVRVWNAASGVCLHILRGHTREVRSVSFSGDGKLIVSGSDDETVRVWEPFLAIQWRELKRDIQALVYLSNNIPLAMTVFKANYYVDSMLKIKKKADRMLIQLDHFDEFYNWCIGVSNKKGEGDTLETSTKRQRTKLVDSMFRLRF